MNFSSYNYQITKYKDLIPIDTYVVKETYYDT